MNDTTEFLFRNDFYRSLRRIDPTPHRLSSESVQLCEKVEEFIAVLNREGIPAIAASLLATLPKPEACRRAKPYEALDEYFTALKSAESIQAARQLTANLLYAVTGAQKVSAPEGIVLDDIVGNQAAVNDLRQLVDLVLLYNPAERMPNPAGNFPTRILLYGEKGCGKTMMTRAIVSYMQDKAITLGRPFCHSDINSSIKDKYFGESEKILDASYAAATNPDVVGIVTVDEADGLFHNRDVLADKPAERSILQKMMVLMNGMASENLGNHLVLFITNRPADIDSALVERVLQAQYQIKGPQTADEYSQLFHLKLKAGVNEGYVQLSTDEFGELGKLAAKTGLSGRAVENLCKSAEFSAKRNPVPAELYNLPQGPRRGAYMSTISRISFEDLTELIKKYDRLTG